VRAAVAAFRLWRQLHGDADARICLGFKRQEEILSEQLREAQARGDVSEEGRVRQLLHRVQDEELSYQQLRMAELARHVITTRAPPGVISVDLPKLPEPDRAGLDAAATVLKALAPADTAEHHFMLGRAFYLAEDFKSALQEYNAALELRPDDAATLRNHGNTLDELGRFEEAIADFDRALHLEPNHLVSLNNRGITLGRLGRLEEAVADFDRALQLRPGHPDTLNNRCLALAKLSRLQEGLADIDRCLGVDRDDPYFLSTHALVVAKLGQHEVSSADFARALAARPSDPRILYDRACALSATGRYEESLRDLADAVAGHPPYRVEARHDPDLEPLRTHPEWGPKFWEIVGTEDKP
jgi:tetratricopeptide (TPR) repeat protein